MGCEVTNCQDKHYGHGLCQKHYARRRRTGPEIFDRFGRYNTPEEKFWLRVDKSGSCWTWMRPLSEDGYGSFNAYGATWKAHRFAYAMGHGPIPDGMDIDHRCRNRACVRPDHLRPVTNKQNAENRSGPVTSRSKTGVRGVHHVKGRNRYRVAVGHNGKLHHGGYYADLEEAAEAARQLRLLLFTHNEMDKNVMAERAAQNKANAARRLAA